MLLRYQHTCYFSFHYIFTEKHRKNLKKRKCKNHGFYKLKIVYKKKAIKQRPLWMKKNKY